MATLALIAARKIAQQSERTILLPVATDDGSSSLAASVSHGPFVAGDQVVIVCNGQFHAVAGVGVTTVSTAGPGPFPAGVYAFTIPDACTHVALIQGAAGAASGCVYVG